MEAKVTCVYDEGALENTGYIGAKGTSFLVDIGGKRVMFDTGLRHRYLLHNLEDMDVPVDSIDAVVVSQAYPDNSKALNGFLDQREKPIDVYCAEGTYGGKAGMMSRSVGLSEDNRAKVTFHNLGDWIEVVPGVTVTPMLEGPNGYREAYLVIDGPTELAVISGRGVGGPAKVLDTVNRKYGRTTRVFIGSVFLEKARKEVGHLFAQQFADAGVTKLYLNHSTSRDGMTNIRVVLGLKGASDFYVGDVCLLK